MGLETWKSVSRNRLQIALERTGSDYINDTQIVVDVFTVYTHLLESSAWSVAAECWNTCSRTNARIHPTITIITNTNFFTKRNRLDRAHSHSTVHFALYGKPATNTHTNKILSMRPHWKILYYIRRVDVCSVTCCANVCANFRPIDRPTSSLAFSKKNYAISIRVLTRRSSALAIFKWFSMASKSMTGSAVSILYTSKVAAATVNWISIWGFGNSKKKTDVVVFDRNVYLTHPLVIHL